MLSCKCKSGGSSAPKQDTQGTHILREDTVVSTPKSISIQLLTALNTVFYGGLGSNRQLRSAETVAKELSHNDNAISGGV